MIIIIATSKNKKNIVAFIRRGKNVMLKHHAAPNALAKTRLKPFPVENGIKADYPRRFTDAIIAWRRIRNWLAGRRARKTLCIIGSIGFVKNTSDCYRVYL